MSLKYLKKGLSYEVDILHADKHGSLIQVDSIIFDGLDLACPNYPVEFAISLWHLKKEVINKVRDSTARAVSNTTLTIYYTSNVLPPLTLFLSQYGIHTKPFRLINGLCNISSLVFEVTVGPCKLPIGNKILEMNVTWKHYLFQQTMTSPTMALKLRIINFLGKLGGAANIGMLENCWFENLSKALAWDKDEHLSFALPFQDMKPTIYLGKKQVYGDCFSLNMGSPVYYVRRIFRKTNISYPLICTHTCSIQHILNSWSLWENTGKKVHVGINIWYALIV